MIQLTPDELRALLHQTAEWASNIGHLRGEARREVIDGYIDTNCAALFNASIVEGSGAGKSFTACLARVIDAGATYGTHRSE